jgi:hypothetical protein
VPRFWLKYESMGNLQSEVKQPRNPWAELGETWPKNEAKVDKLKQSRWSKKPKIIGFLLVDLVLLGPYLQSGFDSRPGHINDQNPSRHG